MVIFVRFPELQEVGSSEDSSRATLNEGEERTSAVAQVGISEGEGVAHSLIVIAASQKNSVQRGGGGKKLRCFI
jgi:hypothetical protein